MQQIVSAIPINNIDDYLAAILVVIGWIVLFRQSLAIRRREEMAQSVQLAVETVTDILSLSKEYYSPSNSEHISYLSAELKGKFVLLSKYLLILRAAGMRLDVREGLLKYKILSTGGHFETTSFLQQLNQPNWREEITYTGLSLRYAIERSYFTWCNQKLNIKSLLLPS